MPDLLSVVVGILSSLVIGFYFYHKSKQDSDEQKRLTELNLHALESAKLVRFNRQGDKYAGVIHELHVVDGLNLSNGVERE